MGTPTRQLPKLAPGPVRPEASSTASSTPPQPKKNSLACLACKQAKRKCTGRPAPCRACAVANIECVFDETLDLRRKIATKRTIDELEGYKELLYSLLETMRSADAHTVQRLIDEIKGNGPASEIAVTLAARLRDLRKKDGGKPEFSFNLIEPISEASGLRQLSEGFSRRSRMLLGNICDIPLFEVPAKPWTRVTDNSQFVSHLVSLYFTWSHPFFQLLSQEVFLRHMGSQRLDSGLCSPFLVNSLLSVSSVYSDIPSAFAVPGDPYSRGLQFFTEAESLWREEEGNATIPNIQGLLLMVLFEDFRGRQKVGWLLLKQAISLAHDLDLFSELSYSPQRNIDMSDDMKLSRAICAWSIFSLNAQFSVRRRSTPDLKPPNTFPIETFHLENDVPWTPYPRLDHMNHAQKLALLPQTMSRGCELARFLTDLCALRSEAIPRIGNEELVDRLRLDLQRWHDHLPPQLMSSRASTPHVLLLWMQFHLIYLIIDGEMLSHQIFEHSKSTSSSRSTLEGRYTTAKEIASYAKIHRDTYGLDHIPCHMLYPASEALYALVEYLDDSDVKEAFIESSRLVLALSKRMKAGEDTLHRLQRKADELNIALPSEVLKLFGQVEHKQSLRLLAESPGAQEDIALGTGSGSASPGHHP